jgi:hypothetical protein
MLDLGSQVERGVVCEIEGNDEQNQHKQRDKPVTTTQLRLASSGFPRLCPAQSSSKHNDSQRRWLHRAVFFSFPPGSIVLNFTCQVQGYLPKPFTRDSPSLRQKSARSFTHNIIPALDPCRAPPAGAEILSKDPLVYAISNLLSPKE